MTYVVRHCSLADKDHRCRKRQYAHTWHYGSNIICVAKAFYRLPLSHQMGLLVHEIGHLLLGSEEHEEYEADLAAMEKFGITVRYKDSRYGDFLQYLDGKDILKLKEILYG